MFSRFYLLDLRGLPTRLRPFEPACDFVDFVDFFVRDAARFRLDPECERFPPLRLDAWEVFLPRPEPDFLPPPDSLLTVAQARLSASFLPTPRFS